MKLRKFEKMKSRRRGPGNDGDPRKPFSKVLNMNLVSIKNMKRKFGKSNQLSIFKRGNPYHRSTYRFPPLHQTGFPGGWGMCFLREKKACWHPQHHTEGFQRFLVIPIKPNIIIFKMFRLLGESES